MAQDHLVEMGAVCMEKGQRQQQHELWGEAKRKLPSLLAFAALGSFVYAFIFILTSHPCWEVSNCWSSLVGGRRFYSVTGSQQYAPIFSTSLSNIVFGIASTVQYWDQRKEYVKLWWRPSEMRGFVWLDQPVKSETWPDSLPPFKVSENTSHFNYTWARGSPSAVRVSRIVSETFRLGLPDVHWFVMGDDDTIFFPDNLVKVLSKYDHRQFYYIGYNSESQQQNVVHSFGMAFGGGGYAISYALAKALEKMQDNCLHRYPHVYGSDSRIQACTAELGVPLTREPGFHQVDLRGDIYGLLAAHPIAPAVSLHHMDAVLPIFPNKSRVEGIELLMKTANVDPSGLLQQTICYDKGRQWSISISSGYAVQIFKSIYTPLDLQTPLVTFLDWRSWKRDGMGFTFNIRPLTMDLCDKPTVFFMEDIQRESQKEIVTGYSRSPLWGENCTISSTIRRVKVVKEQGQFWYEPPRRQCCERLSSPLLEKGILEVKVRSCRDGEVIAGK